MKKKKDIAASMATGNSVNQSLKNLRSKYAKPQIYDRKIYDSPHAKIAAKKKAFGEGKPVCDPYLNSELLLKKRDAKYQFGEDWQPHLAEADHTVSLKAIHEQHKNDAWTTTEDVKKAANSQENIQIVSRKLNNAKRQRTNDEFYGNDEYLKEKDIHLSTKSRKEAIEDGRKAKRAVEQQLANAKVKNVAIAFHHSGTTAAFKTAEMTIPVSACLNVLEILKGEKTPTEALQDVVIDTAKSAGTAYIVGGSLTVIAHTLSTSSSPFIRSLVKSNVPGQVVSAVMATGDTILKFINGKINITQCFEELGTTGINMAMTGYGMTIGQILIPIPIVGATVGAMISSAFCSDLLQTVRNLFTETNAAREEYERLHPIYQEAIARIKREREEFKKICFQQLLHRESTITDAFRNMNTAITTGNLPLLENGLKQISSVFHQEVEFFTFEDFNEMMLNPNTIFEL